MRNLAISILLLGACTGSASPNTSGDDDQGVDAGHDPGTALPATAFVVLTGTHDGPTRLVRYDVATSTHTQLAELDDASITGIALGPDRRTVAFTGLFRPEAPEVALGYPADSMWLVGVDGAFHRLTPPAADHSIPGPDYSIEMGSPTWSPDGMSVFITQGQWWMDGSTLTGGQQLGQVPIGGGFATTWTGAGSACQLIGPGAFSHDGSKAAIARDVCVDGSQSGVWLYANTTLTPLVQRQYQDGQLAWSPDGTTVLQVTLQGLDVIPIPAGMVAGTVPPPVAGSTYTSIAYDPTGRYLAACVNHMQTSDSLYLMDLGAMHPTWMELPGVVDYGCQVSW